MKSLSPARPSLVILVFAYIGFLRVRGQPLPPELRWHEERSPYARGEEWQGQQIGLPSLGFCPNKLYLGY